MTSLRNVLLCAFSAITIFAAEAVLIAAPNPQISGIFPPGGTAGTTSEVTVTGSHLDPSTTLQATMFPKSMPGGIEFEIVQTAAGDEPAATSSPLRFRARIDAATPPGVYDVRTVSAQGVSQPRAFHVTRRPALEHDEAWDEAWHTGDRRAQFRLKDSASTGPADNTEGTAARRPLLADLGCVVSGSIAEKGDVDTIAFAARRGQRVIVECWAERIDSSLRGVVELMDADGRRLAVSRGFFRGDALVTTMIPADGVYVARLHDLVFAGSEEHFYRLSIDTGPRVLFSTPPAVSPQTTSNVTLHGWNLGARAIASTTLNAALTTTSIEPAKRPGNGVSAWGLEAIHVELRSPPANASNWLPIVRRPAELGVDGFAHVHPGSDVPVFVGLTALPIVLASGDNLTATDAQSVEHPAAIFGRLIGGREQHWYTFTARRGEVVWLEGLGDRLGAPIDLDLTILDAGGEVELARFTDSPQNPGGKRFPSAHVDPHGRWIAPRDGQFLVLVRNLTGGIEDDPRRIYGVTFERALPDFDIALVPRPESPSAINLQRGGRELADVVIHRRRGMEAPVRVSARALPPGVECADVWIGPGVDRAPIVFSAVDSASRGVSRIELIGVAMDHIADVNERDLNQVDVSKGGNSDSFLYTQRADAASLRAAGELAKTVRGATVVRGGLPNGSGRLAQETVLAVRGDARLRLTAAANDRAYQRGTVVTLTIDVTRVGTGEPADVELEGAGLPPLVTQQFASIDAAKSSGFLCFYLPESMPLGRYSLAVKAESTVEVTDADGAKSRAAATAFSNVVSFEVYPAPFVIKIDPRAPRKIRRGEVVQVQYEAKRQNGFIGKIHTEMVAPQGIVGLRGRGVTFISQSETGNIQIIASDDAPLGKQPFLQFEAVGTVEDKGVYRSSCFVDLEIIE